MGGDPLRHQGLHWQEAELGSDPQLGGTAALLFLLGGATEE